MGKKICWLIVCALLMGNLSAPLTVLAEEKSSIQLDSDMVISSDEMSEINVPDTFIFNSVFDGKVDKNAVKAEIEEIKNNPYVVSFMSEDSDCATIAEAQAYLRKMMVNRLNIITFIIPYDVYQSTDDIFNVIWNGALAHSETCSGQEGDALYFSWTGLDMGASGNSEGITFTYTVTYDTTLAQEVEMTEALEEIYAELNIDDVSEYEQVKTIYNYICDNVDYDYTYAKHAAYDAVMTGEAVCEGYAMLFYRMCKDYDLSVRMVSGNNGGHGWNIVRIGSVYYNVDATWDGQDEETRSNYFLKNTEDFVGHTRDADWDTDAFHAQHPMAEQSWVDYSTFPEALNVINTEYSFTTLDGGTVTSTASGKPKVLVFYRTTCSYSKNSVKSICAANIENVDIITIESTGATVEDIKTFKSTYGSNSATFAYASSSYMWQYVDAAGLGSSIYFPIIAYIDANNKLQAVTQSVSDAGKVKAYIEYYCHGNDGITINTQPVDEKAMVGETASFTVEADGEELEYQWYYKRTDQTSYTKWIGKNKPTLSFTVKNFYDNLLVYCVITDAKGNSVETQKATLEIDTLLEITSQPETVRAKVGETAEYKVESRGEDLTYQWYFKLANQTGYTKWSGRTKPILTFTIKNFYDDLLVYCVVTDGNGNSVETQKATLEVVTALEITNHPESVRAKVGETAEYKVGAEGDGLTYQWYYKRTDQTSYTKWIGKTKSTLTFAVKNFYDDLLVYCVVSDADGNSIETEKATLEVVTALEITGQPETVRAKVGETVEYKIGAEGDGLTYQWYYKRTDQTSYTKWIGKTKPSLMFTAKKFYDDMLVYCVVTDADGNSIETEIVTLEIETALEIISQPETVSAKVGENAIYMVEASGEELTYQWYFKLASQTEYTMWSGRTKPTLTFAVKNFYDNLLVYCVVTDADGNSVETDKAMLTV